MTVHFVYVTGKGFDTSTAIAREIPARLRAHHDVQVHDPRDPATIRPEPGDVLIGHPNRHGDCLFRRSFAEAGWARRIVFAPFSHGMLEDAAAIDDLVDAADLYLAITGPYWFDSAGETAVSHWVHKMRRCDLGLNRGQFPRIKSRFNPPGMRRFLYIGNADPMRGGDFLAALADANPDLEIAWIRAADARHCLDGEVEPQTRRLSRAMRGSRLKIHNGVHWRQPSGLKVVATHDVILNCGRSDAMPSEVLEAASWGLVPVTTPQCGYLADDWMTHIPLDDVAGASAVLRALNGAPEADLLARQAAGVRRLDERYNWDAVARQVQGAITASIPPEPDDPAWQARRRRNRRTLRGLLLRRGLSYILDGVARRTGLGR